LRYAFHNYRRAVTLIDRPIDVYLLVSPSSTDNKLRRSALHVIRAWLRRLKYQYIERVEQTRDIVIDERDVQVLVDEVLRDYRRRPDGAFPTHILIGREQLAALQLSYVTTQQILQHRNMINGVKLVCRPDISNGIIPIDIREL